MPNPHEDVYCTAQPFGKGYRCPTCLTPHRLDRKGGVPHRLCSQATKQFHERLKSGPCVHQGEPAGLVECSSCAGKVQIKTFACQSADVPQPRAAWSEKPLPPDVAKCASCDFYVPKKGPPEEKQILTPTHEGRECYGCGAPATQLCAFNGIFVCGAPLCDRCEHTGPALHGPRKEKPKKASGDSP